MAAKLLLVEDDNNLREIYEARLQAEGYTIVTAKDGEEALVVAKAEKPDLIISDVMMPRISGFEMLDILRNTDELKDTRVIMLTALGQADDKTRASSLGADRYLVKSQVTLEDIVKAAHELMEGGPSATPPADGPPPAMPSDTGATLPPASPPTDSGTAPPRVAAADITPQPSLSSMMSAGPAGAPAPNAQPSAASAVAPQLTMPSPAAPAPTANLVLPSTETTAQEKADVAAQISKFADAPAAEPPAEVPPTPTTQADDALLAKAVKDLASSTAPVTPLATPPTPQVIPVGRSMATEPGKPAASTDTQFGSVPIANKKIIQPLGHQFEKPDLNELLAKEEAKKILNTGFNPATAVTSDITGVEAPAVPSSNFDPHNIAL